MPRRLSIESRERDLVGRDPRTCCLVFSHRTATRAYSRRTVSLSETLSRTERLSVGLTYRAASFVPSGGCLWGNLHKEQKGEVPPPSCNSPIFFTARTLSVTRSIFLCSWWKSSTSAIAVLFTTCTRHKELAVSSCYILAYVISTLVFHWRRQSRGSSFFSWSILFWVSLRASWSWRFKLMLKARKSWC